MKPTELSNVENAVYAITKELLKSHKQLNIKEILPECISELNSTYSEEDIKAALTSLTKKKYIIPGTSLTREDVLQNPVRRRILSFIRKNPGAYNRKIRRECSLGSNEFKWHLGMLTKFGYIKKSKFHYSERSFGYFENRDYMGHETDLYLLQNEKASVILKYLERNPSTISSIARELELHYSTVQKYIQIMEEREMILEIEREGQTFYAVNHTLQIRLQKIINGQAFIDFAVEPDAIH